MCCANRCYVPRMVILKIPILGNIDNYKALFCIRFRWSVKTEAKNADEEA